MFVDELLNHLQATGFDDPDGLEIVSTDDGDSLCLIYPANLGSEKAAKLHTSLAAAFGDTIRGVAWFPSRTALEILTTESGSDMIQT